LKVLSRLGYLLSARSVRELLQTAFLICLARQSAATYGEFMLALSLGVILLMVGEFGLNLPLVRLLSDRERPAGEAVALVSLLKAGLLVLAWGGLTAFVGWQDYSPALARVVLVIAAGVGLEALASTFFTALQVEGRQKREGQVRAVAAVGGFGYGLITLALGAPPLVVALFKLVETLANLAGGAAGAAAGARLSWRRPSFTGLWNTARGGVTFALLELTAALYNRSNLIFLQQAAGAAAVAQYSATWHVVDGLSITVSSLLLQSVLFPLFVKLWDTDRQAVSRLARNTARGLLAAAALITFFLYFESDRLILLIYGRHYREAIWLQQWLAATIVFSFLQNLAGFLLLSMRLERLLLAIYAGGLAFNLAACAFLIPRWPLAGTALAIILTKAGLALVTVYFCQRRLRIIPVASLGALLAAALAGAGIYLALTGHVLRGFAEGFAMLPTLALAWRWWRQRELERNV
ncbi:MAG: polysaccharide biosynthesis protein, partial [Deltaproteobacteria bacterium]|nr:polysaccharide biosynthesis protein [Deltaproteobacteria bacterium]